MIARVLCALLSRVMTKPPQVPAHPTSSHRTDFHFYKVSAQMAIHVLKKLCMLVAQVFAKTFPQTLDKMKPLGLSSTKFQRASFYTYLLVFLRNTCSHCDGKHCNGNCSWSWKANTIWKRAQRSVSSGACLTFIGLGNQLLSCSHYKKNILQVP